MDSAEIVTLKEKCLKAQALFSKKAYRLLESVQHMEKDVLISEIKVLKEEFGKMHDAGLDYTDALEETVGAEEETAQVNEEITKCLAAFTKALQHARETLWSQYAEADIQLHADGAEKKWAEVEATEVKKLSETDHHALKNCLREKIHALEERVLEWDSLIPVKGMVYHRQVYNLCNKLRDWERSWQKSQRIQTNKESVGSGASQPTHQVPSTAYAPAPTSATPTVSKPKVAIENLDKTDCATLLHLLEHVQPTSPRNLSSPPSQPQNAVIDSSTDCMQGLDATLLTQTELEGEMRSTNDFTEENDALVPCESSAAIHLEMEPSLKFKKGCEAGMKDTGRPQESEISVTGDAHLENVKSSPASLLLYKTVHMTAGLQESKSSARSNQLHSTSDPVYPSKPEPSNPAKMAEGSGHFRKETIKVDEVTPAKPAAKLTPTKPPAAESDCNTGQSEKGHRRPSAVGQWRKAFQVSLAVSVQPWKWPRKKCPPPATTPRIPDGRRLPRGTEKWKIGWVATARSQLTQSGR
ncbi:uncharacterized protein LOC134443433 [Engraulis encrasicolus]|uniref:uncharacterized protein LOC134443433 n=1 Tax=Engraulis encrasicolus TaxID=184585 RepID=UPI002FCFC61F